MTYLDRDAALNVADLYTRAEKWVASVSRLLPAHYDLLLPSSSSTKKQKQRAKPELKRTHR